jgi:hypothetical protein
MLRLFAIVIAGAGIFASLPLTNAWACDNDRYPCPIRSEALIQETAQAPDQPATDQPQKKPAQPQKKAKHPASITEKAPAKRDREAPRTPAGVKASKPAVPEQTPDAALQKAPEAAPAAVASPRADEQLVNDESRGGSLVAGAATAWPVSPITESAAGAPAATSISTADAASNAVQAVDPNEVNELDRAAGVESYSLSYLLWMLGAALAAAFAMWLLSRMRFLFRRPQTRAEPQRVRDDRPRVWDGVRLQNKPLSERSDQEDADMDVLAKDLQAILTAMRNEARLGK